MSRYLAKLIFQVNNSSQHECCEFDEQIRLINAGTADEALRKARLIGEHEQQGFEDKKSRKISWKFIDVIGLDLLDTVGDGEQVFSNTLNIDDPGRFISYVKQRGMDMQVKSATFALPYSD